MEPRQNGLTNGYESMPHGRGNLEEQSLHGSGEVRERSYENLEIIPAKMEREASTAAPAMPTLPVPVAVPQPTMSQMPTVSDDSAGLAAGDEELIEKEWVDRVKKIISDTRDDPAAREKAVGAVQAEYVRKRYGKIIGARNE